MMSLIFVQANILVYKTYNNIFYFHFIVCVCMVYFPDLLTVLEINEKLCNHSCTAFNTFIKKEKG